MDLCELNALEIADLVKTRQVSASEVLESCLNQIHQVDGRPGSLESGEITEEDRKKVHAFIHVTAARARKQASLVDGKIARGEPVGAFAGVPFSAKDIFCVKDTPSTAASKILANYVAPYTATPVQRMEDQDAILLGKVNLDEFTYGSSTESSAFRPTTRNPRDTSRVPGGSSGGSTAAVGANEGPLSIGTDTAGSIRQPAAFCGVVGLKPTYGRVSRYGLIAFASSLDCPGPVSRTVSDAARMLQVIAGHDKHDSTCANIPVQDYLEEIKKGVKGLRIGLSPQYFQITFPDPDTGELVERVIPEYITAPVRKAATILASLGAEIIEGIPMPHTRYGIPAYFVISRVEAASNLHRYDGVKYGYRTASEIKDLKQLYRKTRAEGFGLQPKLRILMGMYVSAAQYSEQYYNRALKVRSLIRKDFDDAFGAVNKNRVDALITPTTPSPAFEIDAVYGDSVLMQYADQLTVPANHAGIPGISLPFGKSPEGLPLGLQILGPDFREDILFRIAKAVEDSRTN